jgi:hypothetical protein
LRIVIPDLIRDPCFPTNHFFEVLQLANKPGLAPADEALCFCVTKRKYPKKRRPDGLGPLRCASGQPAVLTENGVELELGFASDNRSP